MLVLIGFSVYEDPVTLGIGLALFLGGIPLYFIFSFLRKIKGVIHFMGMSTFSNEKIVLRLSGGTHFDL